MIRKKIAGIIATVLKAIEPYKTEGIRGPVSDGKIDFKLLEELRVKVADIAEMAGIDY